MTDIGYPAPCARTFPNHRYESTGKAGAGIWTDGSQEVDSLEQLFIVQSASFDESLRQLLSATKQDAR